MTNTIYPTCDWHGCHETATMITHHERKNTGTVTAYWCVKHYETGSRVEELLST
jgi:hypothetical protein